MPLLFKFIDAERLFGSYFGQGPGPIISFDCTGAEVTLQDCNNYTQSYYCYGHAGVKCEQSMYQCTEHCAIKFVF